MALNSANVVNILVGTTSPAASALAVADSSGLNISPVIQTVTHIGDTAQKRKYTLQDYSVSLSGNYDGASTALGILEDAALDGDTVYVIFEFDGTNGYEGTFIVTGFTLDVGGPDAVVTWSCSLECTSDLTIVT